MSSSGNLRPWESAVLHFLRSAWDVPEDMPASQALKMVERAPYEIVLVTRRDSKELTGVITKSDFPRLLDHMQQSQIKKILTSIDVATSRLIALPEDATVADALKLMYGENSVGRPFRILPVVNREHEVLGVVLREELERTFPGPSSVASNVTLSY